MFREHKENQSDYNKPGTLFSLYIKSQMTR